MFKLFNLFVVSEYLLVRARWFPHWRKVFQEDAIHALHTKVLQRFLIKTVEFQRG